MIEWGKGSPEEFLLAWKSKNKNKTTKIVLTWSGEHTLGCGCETRIRQRAGTAGKCGRAALSLRRDP